MQATLIELERNENEVGRWDGRDLSIDRLCNLSLREIESLRIPSDRGPVPLSSLFQVTIRPVDAGEPVLLVRGLRGEVNRLAMSTTLGCTIVLGNVGEMFAREQRGGEILLLGSAGDFAGQGRSGGLLFLSGNSGDHLAGPCPGDKSGMRGGDLIVLGDVGSRALERMRRGTVAIRGQVEGWLAPNWIAGTIYVEGPIRPPFAQGMKRGSLIVAQEPAECREENWSSARLFELSFLPLVWKHLAGLQTQCQQRLSWLASQIEKDKTHPAQLELSWMDVPTTRWASRRVGDRLVQGKGELLVVQKPPSSMLPEI